jgi:hypothetical protein
VAVLRLTEAGFIVEFESDLMALLAKLFQTKIAIFGHFRLFAEYSGE